MEPEPAIDVFQRYGLSSLFQKPEKAKSWGWDTSRYLWGEAHWDLLLEIEPTKIREAPQDFNRGVVLEVEMAILAVLQAIRGTMERNSQRFIEVAGLNEGEHGKFFPWLSWPFRQYFAEDFPGINTQMPTFENNAPLAGQRSGEVDIIAGTLLAHPGILIAPSRVEIDLTTFQPGRLNSYVPIVVVKITSISFEEGSLWSWIQGNVLALGLAATLLSGGIPPTVDLIRHMGNVSEWNQSVVKAEDHEPAYLYRNFRYSSQELERVGERAFNFRERGISADERRHRIDLTQLALKMILKIELRIDGQVGPETIAALKELGRLHGLPGNIENPFVRAELLKGLTLPK